MPRTAIPSRSHKGSAPLEGSTRGKSAHLTEVAGLLDVIVVVVAELGVHAVAAGAGRAPLRPRQLAVLAILRSGCLLVSFALARLTTWGQPRRVCCL